MKRTIIAIAASGLLLAGCSSDSEPSPPAAADDAIYHSCDEAEAAGAAPLKRGTPEYNARLDRDGDGIACAITPTSEPAEAAPNLAAAVERELTAAFGVQSLAETCAQAAWPCYINGFAEPSPGNVVVTIQETGAAAEEYGQDAARLIWTLINRETAEQLTLIQSVDAMGSPIATISKSQVPAFN